MPATIETLREVPLFAGISDPELKRILEIGKEVTHTAGRQVVEADQSGVGLHVILEGQASIHVGGAEVGRFGPGEYFGEMSVIDGKPRSASVVADTDLVTFAIPAWNFERLMEQQPSIMRALLVELSGRIRAIEETRS
ncbi:MAG: cyclic nucleotide-binding domain-containing protein [Actinomycetota bacterium]